MYGSERLSTVCCPLTLLSPVSVVSKQDLAGDLREGGGFLGSSSREEFGSNKVSKLESKIRHDIFHMHDTIYCGN